MKTVPLPPLSIMSRPWSKNWPKKVNQLFDGADRPLSGVTLLMNRLCARPGMAWLLAEACRRGLVAERADGAPGEAE